MADGSDTMLTAESEANVATPGNLTPGNLTTGNLIAGIKTFASVHGGVRAAVEYVGRRGARIVLVGEDGEWAEYFAEGTDIARQACSSAGVRVDNEWERELMEQMRPSNDLWRSMSRRILAR